MSQAPKILLLQARDADDPAKAEEVRSFARHCGLDPEQIVSWDLLQGPPPIQTIRRHNALMVGGSGDYYVSQGNLPEFPRLLERLREVVEIGFPTFASCFGFQCLVVALDGEIVYDPENTEVGTHDVTLTAEGQRDELFSSMPRTFQAQFGRKDRAAGPWDGVTNLASSQRCPVQALRIPGKPVWASQFHPELDRETNIGRFERYLEGYAAVMAPLEQQQALDNFRDSLEANTLLRRFLDLVWE